MRKILSVILAAVVLLSLCSCTRNSESTDSNFYDEFPTGDETVTVQIKQNPVATVTLEDGSEIKIELYYYSAPNTVADFIALADAGVYDSMAFNIVRNKCIVMMGSLDGDYEPPYYVMDELGANENALSHEEGVVSMIRESKSNTVTGQFFILTEDQTHFDSTFTSFGNVIQGMDIVNKIAASELDENNYLVSPYVIKSVTVETYGIDFPSPTIIPNE